MDEKANLPMFLTVSQVADILNIREQTVRQMLSSGQIAGVRVGGGPARRGRWRIPNVVIEKMLRTN